MSSRSWPVMLQWGENLSIDNSLYRVWRVPHNSHAWYLIYRFQKTTKKATKRLYLFGSNNSQNTFSSTVVNSRCTDYPIHLSFLYYFIHIVQLALPNMGWSPNYGRKSNIFHITNGLDSLHRKWHTGSQYMVKSVQKIGCGHFVTWSFRT